MLKAAFQAWRVSNENRYRHQYFADRMNVYTGRAMTRGKTVFVSFDKKAIRLLNEQGITAMSPL